MTDLRFNRLNPRQQALWDQYAPDAFKKLDCLGLDHKDIWMSVEPINVERHMIDWKYRCDLCGDIVPKKDYSLCDMRDKYVTLDRFVGNIHFTVDHGSNVISRVIFYEKDRKPNVSQRPRIPHSFHKA